MRRRTREDVDRAGARHRRVCLIAVNSRGRTGFADGADSHRVPVVAQGQRRSELVALLRVGGLYVSLLNPRAAIPRENINRSGIQRGMIRLIPIYPFRRAVFGGRAHGHGFAVAAERHGESELVVLTRIGGFDVGNRFRIPSGGRRADGRPTRICGGLGGGRRALEQNSQRCKSSGP